MASFSEAREISSVFDGYDRYIEQVQQVLRANDVDFGSPFDFLTLAATLENDSRLRSDLVALLQSFMEEKKNISLHTVLNILAVASGGPDLASSNGDGSQLISNGSQPVNTLVDFLFVVGGRSPANPQILDNVPDSPPPVSRPELHPDPRPESHPGLGPELIDGEMHQAVLLPPPVYDQDTHSEPFDGAGDERSLEAVPIGSDQDSSHAGAENSLVESLIRLELNSLQVKHYLDSIDQRISRIEPRLDNLPAHAPSPSAPHLASGSRSGSGQPTDARYSALIATETLANPLEDEPSLLPSRLAETSISPEMLSLLQSASRQRMSQKKSEVPIITAAAIVLLLLLYWGFDQSKPSITIRPVTTPLSENKLIPPSSPVSPAGLNTSRPSESAASLPSQSQAAPSRVLSERVHNSASRTSTPIHPGASSPPSSASATVRPPVAASAHPEESSDPSGLSTEPINVASGVMAANILSAPQPSYPMLASLTRMQGEVVMQAVISKDGTIENVHVIKGHRLLRGAAKDAVRTWRYRPYLVNGQPVEVATTVSVDFRRPQ